MESDEVRGKKGNATKPPDDQTRKPTFKEKVLGVAQAGKPPPQNLLDAGVMNMTLVEGNNFFPMFDFEPSAYENICQPWLDCLVVKLLGKNIGYNALCEKLRMLWKLSGGYEVRYVHHGYYLIKFDMEEDKKKVIFGAPWMIYHHYLSVKP